IASWISTYISRRMLRCFTCFAHWQLPVVYPQFRSFYTNVVVNRAHDDYLQLLAEMGALGFATMLWFLVVLYRNGIKKLDNWAMNISGAISLAALLGCAGILVHGF